MTITSKGGIALSLATALQNRVAQFYTAVPLHFSFCRSTSK